MIRESFFDYKHASLHYTVAGHGQKVLLAFHGYGQTNEHLRELEAEFYENYTVYAFDLFYHGNSFWHKKDEPLDKAFWADLMYEFLNSNGIKDFSLLGFSMGGKLVLCTLEKFPHRIEEVILIAPDGVKTSFWYSLATYPGIFRKLFRLMVVNPVFYKQFFSVLRRIGIVDRGLIRFASTQMASRDQRRRVYYSWMIFRKLRFDLRLLGFVMNQNNIRLKMFLGKFDRIILLKNMNRLIKKVKSVEVHLLNAGHSNLISSVAEFYRKEKQST